MLKKYHIGKVLEAAEKHQSFRKIKSFLLEHDIHLSAQEVYDILNPDSDIAPCGKSKRFVGYSVGYRYCGPSNKCRCSKEQVANKIKGIKRSEETKTKRIKTNNERYGCDNQFERKDIPRGDAHTQSAVEKRKATNIEKYGFDNPAKCDAVKEKIKLTNVERYGYESVLSSPTIQEQIDITNIKKYGTKFVMKNGDIASKAKQTCLDRYGAYNPSKNEKVVNKIRNSLREKYADNVIQRAEDCSIISKYQSTTGWLSFKCNKCDLLFEDRFISGKSVRCPSCYKKSFSDIENSFFGFLTSEYKKTIKVNDRTIISPKEIDFYLPDLKVGFELNGLYWHSSIYKEKKYHLSKTNSAEKAGIHLIHIYQDDWIYKKDIVKNRIRNILGNSQKYYGRKCVLKALSSKDYRYFNETYHIQGSANASIRLGLYHNGILVAVMGFSKKRFGSKNKNSYELIRYCSSGNVVGGASKLLSYFKKNYNWDTIVSYCDRSWSKGGLYRKLGFKEVKKTPPNYYYIEENAPSRRIGRMHFQKKKIGGDLRLTEEQIMNSRGYYRVYDSGSILYSLDNIEN